MNERSSEPLAARVELTRVWDRPVRLLHWTLALAVSMAWLSTLGFGWARMHEPIGYVALAAIALRVLWGFAGSPHARFDAFVLPIAQVMRYAREVRAGTEARYLGHNPLGGWMVICLLTVTGAACITGWLFTTDYFWGSDWISDLHLALAWAVLALVVLHVCGVIFTSVRHRENLIGAMFTGMKRAAQDQGASVSACQGTASRTGRQTQGS